MELVQELSVFGGKKFKVDESSLVRAKSQILKSLEIWFAGVDNHDHVFDSNSELTIFVVAWLI